MNFIFNTQPHMDDLETTMHVQDKPGDRSVCLDVFDESTGTWNAGNISTISEEKSFLRDDKCLSWNSLL